MFFFAALLCFFFLSSASASAVTRFQGQRGGARRSVVCPERFGRAVGGAQGPRWSALLRSKKREPKRMHLLTGRSVISKKRHERRGKKNGIAALLPSPLSLTLSFLDRDSQRTTAP